MKLGAVIATTEVQPVPPVALLTGSFPERLAKTRRLGYQGIKLMVLDPACLEAEEVRATIYAAGLEPCAVASGAVAFAAKLMLMHREVALRAARPAADLPHHHQRARCSLRQVVVGAHIVTQDRLEELALLAQQPFRNVVAPPRPVIPSNSPWRRPSPFCWSRGCPFLASASNRRRPLSGQC